MPTASTPARVHHVLIVNQHGDNRGDEAAMLAMLDALAERFAPVRFTVLHQFNDPASAVDGGHDVEFVPLAPRGVALPRLAAATALCLLRLPWRAVAGRLAVVLDAYRDATLVVSAPGGPYLGDIYADHEPLHWAYVVLAGLFRRPAMLYAPSVGPFRRRLRSPARRFVFRRFRAIAVREARSAEHLAALFGPLRRHPPCEVTVDAALGSEVTPLAAGEWPGTAPPPDHTIIAASVIDHRYPGTRDVDAARRRHDDAVVAALSHLARRRAPAHVVLLPQVHGRHRDGPYLDRIGARLRAAGVSCDVMAESVPSRVQQRVFASADLVLAGRYHPAVFSLLGAVPAVCIAYEHKTVGLMESAGLGELVVPIEAVTTERLVALVDRVVDQRDQISVRLQAARPELRARALRTADLAAEVAGLRPAPAGREAPAAFPAPVRIDAHPKGAPALTPMAWMRWDAVARAVREVAPRRILEVGAGQGAMGYRLATVADYLGVEPDEQSCAVARDRLAALGRGEVRCGDVAVVPDRARFDLVCAFEVLEHIDDDITALRAWREHLEPGGRLLLSVPAHRDRFGAADAAVGHHRRYDRVDLERVLEKAGFEVVWVRGYGAGLGHALEAVRNALLRRRAAVDRTAGTARSGRLYQPPPAAAPVVAALAAPFRALQAPWSGRGIGVGYVALAARAG